ncbi:interleukin-36 beta [Equus przewalskii]|uniref:Interleukin-1 n=1 Tax=Equus przewalskii TaxID=9798 RepID=A0ABM2FBT7_EQUPR|nr:PREDICTED: interleukin-36 beta [Equus przewalskii]XP_008526657.1 PREDICTED: interleukin-36 beta [Equus przewalskii]
MATPQSKQIPDCFRVRDPLQMVWVVEGDSLMAVPFNNNVKPVTLDIISCTDEKLHDEAKGNLVYLGIKGTNHSLFCAKIQGQPTLQIKEKNVMDLHHMNEGQKPFLFFRIIEGTTSAFQSFSCPGWFIATSSTARQPITLTKERGGTENTNFYLEPEH